MVKIEIESTNLRSVEEAAKETGIPRPTLYRWIEQDKATVIKIGGRLFFTTAEVERLKKEQETVDEPAPA
jgi:excisionase family DNA binding protein